jgi:hypothetical protein
MYDHLFDGTVGKFNMEPISFQLLEDFNCNPVPAHAYTIPRSVEQRARKLKDW